MRKDTQIEKTALYIGIIVFKAVLFNTHVNTNFNWPYSIMEIKNSAQGSILYRYEGQDDKFDDILVDTDAAD